MLEINKIHLGDALKLLKKMESSSIHCIVTSPPYWALRDYGVKGQIGLEDTPKKFISKLVKIFRECRRVLRHDGTLWVNMGDSYATSAKTRTDEQICRKSGIQGGKANRIACKNQPNKAVNGLKPKDLVGIPWMLAFALRADGWWLREEIIWSKPNCMPESIKDRCTRSHEYIFHLSKSSTYYHDYEAIKTDAKYPGITGMDQTGFKDAKTYRGKHADKQRGHVRTHQGFNERWDNMTVKEQRSMGANKRSVWTVPPRPFKEAHFAVFPPELIIDCIKAGCPEGGVVLDPFMGAGTTALVAAKLNRQYIGIELNPEYIKIAESRMQKELGLFNKVNSKT